MQLGLTISLQKHLKLKSPSYGKPTDLFFCWELHIIRFQGKNAFAAVNANNRFLVLMVGMKVADWKLLQKRFEEAVTAGFLSEGYTKEQIDAYFSLADEPVFTKTHGRKPVGGMNKAIDYLYYLPEPIDPEHLYQEFHCRFLNRDICSPIGFEDYGYPVEFLEVDMNRIGIINDRVNDKNSNIIEFRSGR
ncbi:DUF6933 domain-containing protein [Lachnotalea glycerini]|uniref:DUF6933 domain-containing protein n=1 Tax=Lachnotalea glycerini TaxID=1763509 RepID=A0A371JFZ9_9FIRM|nr:hypothetical protein [Lachnotalea glycerini]RDY31670.1 hypothetical protein CG710_008760 [Lachnotalea glycerini]